MESPNFSSKIDDVDSLTKEILQVEERIASRVSETRELASDIEQALAQLDLADQSAVSERWLNAVEERLDEFLKYEDETFWPNLIAWHGGVLLGLGSIAAITTIPPLPAAIALTVTTVSPFIGSRVQRLLARRRASNVTKMVKKLTSKHEN